MFLYPLILFTKRGLLWHKAIITEHPAGMIKHKRFDKISLLRHDSTVNCPVYDTKIHPVVRLQFQTLGKRWVIHLMPFLLWGLKGAFDGQGLRARVCCPKISDSIFWLYYFTPRWLAGAMPCPKKSSKRNVQKEEIETDKRRKHFFHTFLYLLGEWTNQRYVPRRSVVPKTPDSKMMLLVRRTLPDKTRFTENLNIYLSPPAPKFATPKSF